MIQSVYKRDFRDPKQIIKLWQLLSDEKLKSNFQHLKSIYESGSSSGHEFSSKSEIDTSATKRRQMGSERENISNRKASCDCLRMKKPRRQNDNEVSSFQLNGKEKYFKPQKSFQDAIERNSERLPGKVSWKLILK
jgi:hypothetical protein